MDDVPGEVESALIDLSEFAVANPETLDNPVLASMLAKILGESECPDDAVAGFNSSL